MTSRESYFDGTPEPGSRSEIEQLRALLYTDDLTGLYNRRFFRHCIAEQKSQSDSTGTSFALLVMDVDHFKQINDTYGHTVGDEALIEMARVLREVMRDKGWVFRYAGDEFVAILRNSGGEHASSICSHILKHTSLMHVGNSDSSPQNITLSIGFALYPNDRTNISELMDLADRALYASKEAGRNSFHSGQEVSHRESEQSSQWPIRVHCGHLIARQQQWNLLHEYLAKCTTGQGHGVLLTGQAGIGKSRLLKQITRSLRASDYHLLFGECTESTTIHPYAAFRDALNKGFEAKDPATVNVYKELNENHRRELITLVPQFDRFEKTPLAAAQSPDRYLLLESILLLLQGLARQLPTVIIVEDIHWSDEATLNLLQYLCRNIGGDRILLVATFREEEAAHSSLPELLGNLSRENLYELISLKPLTRDETSLMIKEIFGSYAIPENFPRWIYQETEGNPFYIEEFIKILLEEEYVTCNDREIRLQKPEKFLVPYSIRALIQRRINRLNDNLKRVLGYAAIIGYEFELFLLLDLIDENEGYLLDMLESLTRMQLIQEVASDDKELFRFTHKKILDVIYEDMAVIKRRKFHQRVGEILENAYSNNISKRAEVLAHHFEKAGVIDKAFAYSLEAGKNTFHVHAYHDAQMYFKRCFQYLDLLEACSPDSLADLYVHNGLTLEALEQWEQAIQSFEGLLSLKESGSFEINEVEGLNHLSRVFHKQEEFPRSLSLAERALEISQRIQYTTGICKSFHNIGKSHWRICNYDLALKNMKAAIDMTDQQNDSSLKAKLLNTAGIILYEQSNYDSALNYFYRALDIFQIQNDRLGQIRCMVNMGIMRHLQGDLREGRHQITGAFHLAQETGDMLSVAACSVNLAEIEYKLANSEAANRLNQRANRIYQELNHYEGTSYVLQNKALNQMTLGQLQEALASILKAKSIAQEKGLRRRTLELLRDEAAIHYYMADYVSTLDSLDEITSVAEKVDDVSSKLEAHLKRGFVYFALNDLPKASDYWKAGVSRQLSSSSIDFLFWRTASAAFLSALENQQMETLRLQDEMRIISEKTAYAYLIIATNLLKSYQFHILKQYGEALKYAEEAEKRARHYHQDLWLTRSRIRVLEARKHSGQPLEKEELRTLLNIATHQNQNSIVSSCYRLLSEIDPSETDLRLDWESHWNTWRGRVPESHQVIFDPLNLSPAAPNQ